MVLASTSAAGRRVLVLAGPTAVGKSALALRLCELLQGELISVDSVQVYRGLAIGSNKPSLAERGAVRHHLLDLRDPVEEYTAGAFYNDALRAVDQVLARGNLPVLVGGTSMYLRWLTRGRPEAPKADAALSERVRQQLAPFEEVGDWPSALERLAAVDPARAAKLSKNDWYRLNRALCVALQTSSTAAELPPPPDPEGLDELRQSLDMRCFFLSAPREALCRRIDSRCEEMLSRGLFEETSDELRAARLLPSCPAGRSIGYRQVLAYLTRPRWETGDAAALREFAHGFASASRQYARQQSKWFRSEPSFMWVSTEEGARAAEETVLDAFRWPRETFDANLGSATQAALRAVKPKAEQREMRLYLPTLPLVDDDEACAQLVARADACRASLAPLLPELARADEEMARRFPWHRREEGAARAGGEDEAEVREGGEARSEASSLKRPADAME